MQPTSLLQQEENKRKQAAAAAQRKKQQEQDMREANSALANLGKKKNAPASIPAYRPGGGAGTAANGYVGRDGNVSALWWLNMGL